MSDYTDDKRNTLSFLFLFRFLSRLTNRLLVSLQKHGRAHSLESSEDDNSGNSLVRESKNRLCNSTKLGCIPILINRVEGEGWDSLSLSFSLSVEFSRLRLSFDTKATVSDVKVFHTQ